MRILAILCPPVAVLICGKPFQALLNCALIVTLVGPWIHAWMVVSNYYQDKRTDRIVNAMQSRQ